MQNSKTLNKTEKFLQSISNVTKKGISDSVLEKAKKSLLDYIAVTTAGSKSNEERLERFFTKTEPEPGNSTLIGMSRKTNLKDAVFFNGLNGHALDIDDGTNTGIIHLGSPIFSVLIPLAEKYSISLRKLLEAAVIGYETSFTMATSIQPQHKFLGYHATGTCGVLGIAISAAKLLDFSDDERENAFSIAALSSSGMLKVLDDESELKPYNVAKSALLGLVSIQMAKMGFKGHPDVLSGDRGFLKMMTGSSNIEFKEPYLNNTYAIEKTYTKPYAACRYCHPAIEAAIFLREKLDVNEIQDILVSTYDLAVSGHDHVDIQGVGSAKMSIPYGIAVGLINGKAGISEYENKNMKNQAVMNLLNCIRVETNPKFSSVFPEQQSSLVRIRLKNGQTLSKQVDFPKGEPENPLSNMEFNDRFFDLLLYAGRSKQDGINIIEFCNDFNNNVTDLCKFL